MENVSFEISVKKSDVFLPNGCDEVEFLVSANKGEPLMPLSKIASGGEISRIMLALKCAMADKEKTPTLIFDEIDTGISGKTSYKIGIKMRQSSQTSQMSYEMEGDFDKAEEWLDKAKSLLKSGSDDVRMLALYEKQLKARKETTLKLNIQMSRFGNKF